MTIHIEDLKFQAILGILDFERVTPQEIIINITIEYLYNNDFIDYSKVVTIVKYSMIKNKFLLIEDALESLQSELLTKFSSIKNLSIKISKPSILPDCKVSVSDYYKSES